MASPSGEPREESPEFSCIEYPSDIEQLRQILSEYPDGGQILKELIQNADDAGATEMKIMLESRPFNRDLTEDSPLFTKFFQAPALCIYNDAEFTGEDWQGLRMISMSVKKKTSLKVGRFGLGFRSVFHITDYPCVISGDTIMFIDPQMPREKVNARVTIRNINMTKDIRMSDLLRAMSGKFGFCDSTTESGKFHGTIFWFPLREKASPISDNVYNVEKIEKLLCSLHDDASSILIFLKSLYCLHLSKISLLGNDELVLRVRIKDQVEIQQKRQTFYSCIRSASIQKDVTCVLNMTIAVETPLATIKTTQWLVVNYYIVDKVSDVFKRLIQSPNLGLSPCVGVAAQVEPLADVEGHIFCFLPLPKDGSNLTGLPFHVNGFFALSQNRHHIKWATDDQDRKYVNDEILWNQKLLTEAMPLAFQKALDVAIEISMTKQNPMALVDGVYLWIANLKKVIDKLKPFVVGALQSCAHKTIVFCEQLNSWKCVSEVVFTTFKKLPAEFDYVKQSTRKAIGVCGKWPIIVPEHVFRTYKSLFKNRINDISPVMLADILKQKPNYKCMTDQEKNELLAYLISDGDTTKLEGLDFLLLASGEWDTFKQNGSIKYICSEIEVNMFPGNGHNFIIPYERLEQRSQDVMRFICNKKNYPIRDKDDDFLKKLLLQTLQTNLGTELIITENSNLKLDWLRDVWNATSIRGIQRYLDVPIFPVLECGSFESNYQVKLVPLHNINLLLKRVHTNFREQCLDDELEECLRFLGVTIITQLPSWVPYDLIMEFVVCPSNDDVKELLQNTARIIDEEMVNAFNENASGSNRARFLDFLTHVCPLNSDLLHLLQQLRLFMSIEKLRLPGTFVCAQSSTLFVRESEKDQFPRHIRFPENCIKVNKSEEIIAELLGCTHMTLSKFMQLKLHGMQLDVFTRENRSVILYFLKNIDTFDDLIGTASEIPFIKNTVGQRVKPSEVFDPFDQFLKRLFNGEDVLPSAVDAMRPFRNAFIKLGMKRISEIRTEDLYNVAKSVDSRSKKGENICEKASALQEFLEQNPHVLYQTVHIGETLGQAIKDLSCFLYSSPDKCGLHIRYPKQLKWFSITLPVCPPQDMKEIQFWELVCSSMPLIQTRSNELSLFYGWNEPPENDQIILQLHNFRDCSISSDMRLEFMSMIKTVYQVLSKNCNQKVKDDIESNALVWTDDAFLSPSKVVVFKKDDDIDLKPYMHFLPPELVSIHTFFEWLGCRSRQDEHVIVSVLTGLKIKYENNNQNPDETKKDLKLAVSILDRLAEINVDSSWANANVWMVVRSNSDQNIKFATLQECVYFDDPYGFENVVSDECLCGVHEQISIRTAKKLGVKFITRQSLKDLQIMRKHTHAIPFGQREELTTRLHGILKDYPCDESIMKELIQNADDAGAKEIHFIKYFESKHVGPTLENDSELKPALCVYNDSCFKENDFLGIRELGIGSKAKDPSKIGRFGIGFNAVYHITDVPSFLTKGPDWKGRGEVCLFDPLLKHIRALSNGEPGVRYNVDDLMEEFPDSVVGFPDMANSRGTMFRLPLRQEESKISNNCFKPVDIEILLNNLVETMPECLHFVKNIRSIKVLTYNAGKYKCEYEVKSEMTDEDKNRLNSFFESVEKTTVTLSSNQTSDLRSRQFNVEYTTRIYNCTSNQSTTWLIANQFGPCSPLTQYDDILPITDNGLFPIGGVSILLCENPREIIEQIGKNTTDGKAYTGWKPVNGNAYCFLPLPISTGLPFHVNGNFSLDRGRRLLWNQGYGGKWNECLLSSVVLGALINALKYLQKYLIENNLDLLQDDVLRQKYLQMFFCHFPRQQYIIKMNEWTFFAKEFYRFIIEQRVMLFPFFTNDVHGIQIVQGANGQRSVEWIHLSTDISCLDGGVVDTLRAADYDNAIDKERHVVKSILRKLLIKVSDTDVSVVTTIKNIIEVSVICTDEASIINILKQYISAIDSRVETTVFETSECVKILTQFVSRYGKFEDEIIGLPLCLTNDNVLRTFIPHQELFCSEFCDILPGSSHLFLHKDLVPLLNNERLRENNIFKRFSMQSLGRYMSSSFDPEIFCKGKIVRWKDGTFALFEPSIVYMLFKFLHGESCKKISECDIRTEFDKELFLSNSKILSRWSLLPSRKTYDVEDVFELIPLDQSYTLLSDIHLCDEVTRNVLLKLQLPSLDEDLLTQCNTNRDVFYAVQSLSSSTRNPINLLRCLHHFRLKIQSMVITGTDARCLLRYFNNNLNVLRRDHVSKVISFLKNLPIYKTIQGNLVTLGNNNVLLLKSIIPTDSLDIWTQRQEIILVKHHEELKDLYTFLDLHIICVTDLYEQYILPNLKHIPKQHWLSHIKFIKDNLIHYSSSKKLSPSQNRLVELVRKIPFIEVDGTYFCAYELYDRTHIVFQTMIDPILYLPCHFEDWKCFLELLGLNVRPSVESMLSFANRIASEGSLRLTNELIKSSNILVEYLLEPPENEFKERDKAQMYSDIKNIGFVVPYSVPSQLATISKPHNKAGSLICFEGSCCSKFADICWTSVPLLSHIPNGDKYTQMLGIQSEPHVDSVISHCQNICGIFRKDFEKEEPEIQNKGNIMEHIYDFLSTHIKEIDLERLIETPIILIPDETMVKATSVILRHSVEQELKPYLYQAPTMYQFFFPLFETLGATAEAHWWQFANVLSSMQKEFNNKELPRNVLEKASILMKNMFTSLPVKKPSSSELNLIKVLYLPNAKHILKKSSELTICDNYTLRKKFEMAFHVDFFIGFQEVEIDFKDPVKPFMNLPDILKPSILSQGVTETVCFDDILEDIYNEDALQFETLLYSNEFYVGLCRLLWHQNACSNNQLWTEEDDIKLKIILSQVRIKAVTGLKTILAYKGHCIPGITMVKRFFVKEVTNTDNENPLRNNRCPEFHLLYENDRCSRSSTLSLGLMKLVDVCTRDILGKDLSLLVFQLLDLKDNPECISERLDEHQIRAYGSSEITHSVFPRLGTYVEQKFYPFLVQQIKPIPENKFRFVALEIENNGEGDETEQMPYIYAHVLRKIPSSDTSVLSITYEVDAGHFNTLHGSTVVPVIRLYTFLPKIQENETAIQLYDLEHVMSKESDETCESIRNIIQEAFQNFTLKDQNRIIRRLLLQWRPDKNSGNEEYATHMFNFIQHCILRLENGEMLTAHVEPCAPDMKRSRYWTACVSAFSTGQEFTRCFNDNIEDYRKSVGLFDNTHRDPVHNPSEFKRWIRQAKEDFLTGQAHLNCTAKHPKTYNWICYNCHQACEKALKAAWFLNDADNCPAREHSLIAIANGLDRNIADQALCFESRLDIKGHYYFKLRYPDRVNICQIPSDVFTKEDADFAVQTTQIILEMVEKLL